MSSFRSVARLSLAAALLAACADGTPTDPTLRAGARSASRGENPAELHQALAAARAATARFHRVEVATAAGYVPGSPCVAVPGVGGMGIHYVNPAMIADPALDVTQPEVLVYEPQANGALRLVAIEYMGPQAAYAERPSLFGLAFENGPAIPTPGGMMPTYALHAWVWQHNPSGTFAAFNPTVSCANAPAPAAAHH